MLPLVGYADRFSVAPGETIAFKVSSASAEPYRARLVRVICGDPNPAGPGIRERDVPAPFAGQHSSRAQPVPLGSYARVADATALRNLASFTATAIIWPTTPGKGRQGILAKRDDASGAASRCGLGARGPAPASATAAGALDVEVGKPLRERAWYRVSMAYDAAARTLAVRQPPLEPAFGVDDAGEATVPAVLAGSPDAAAPLYIAALGGEPVGGHFNGKIEAPSLLRHARADGAAAARRGRDRRVGLLARHHEPARRRRRPERAPRRARQPAGAGHDGSTGPATS